MAENFTTDQKKAIEAESGTLLVAAAAGSGKTSVLTQRIIRKLTGENPVSPDSLLVVTFTRAAAAEMKDRVYKSLSKMIASASPVRRSELEHIRSRLADMNVSTMDSFCMNVVKTWYHRLGIDAEINIMDPGEAEILRRETADALTEKILSEDKPRLELLSSAFAKTGTDYGISDVVIALSDFSMSEPEPAKWIDSLPEFYNPDADISVWTDVIRRHVGESFSYMLALINYCRGLTDEVSPEKHRISLEDYLDSVIPYLEAYEDIKDAPWDEYCEKVTGICNNFTSAKFPVLRNACAEKDIIKAKRDCVKGIAGGIPELFSANSSQHREDMQALYPVVCALSRTVNEYNEALLEIKKKKHTYEFGDIMHFALRLLYDSASPDGKTEIAREYGAQFTEILIDEYQDTNAAQDALFTALSKGGGENMFMVGDVKQSIYSFRLANPAIFMEKCDSFPLYDDKEIKSKILLRENFRCREGIVKAVNFIFGQLMSRETGAVEYNSDAALNFGAEYYKNAGEKATPDVFFHLIDGEDGAEAEAEYIASDILKRLETDTVLTRDGVLRKAYPGDFAVIVRSMSGTGEIYKKVFEKHGLSIVASKGGRLYNFAEIRLLVSFLKAIDNPGDSVAVTAVALSQFFGFTPDDLALIKTALKKAGRKKAGIYAGAAMLAAEGNLKCVNLTEKLSYFRRLSEGEGVSALLRDIDSAFSFSDSCLAMESGEIRYNNIMLLMEDAAAAEERGIGTPGEFARYIDSLREIDGDMKSAASGGGENSVRLITIHGSKGLEYPFVYIANLGKRFNKSDVNASVLLNHAPGLGIKRREKEKLRYYPTLPHTALQLIKDREFVSEEMRIYYVALTRARENLIIVSSAKDAAKKIAGIESRIIPGKAVPPQFIGGCASADAWFIAAFARHESGIALRVNDRSFYENCGRAEITVSPLTRSDDTAEGEEELCAQPDRLLLEEITRRASFVYPRAEIASRLSRYTASTAEDRHFSKQKFTRKKPAFLNPGGALTGAEKGTATHLFMEFCDFEGCGRDLEAEIERIRLDGKISDTQAKGLDRAAIKAFVSSPVMELIRSADEVFRERRFFVGIPLSEADRDVPAEFADEPVVIIGQLDLLLIKDGRATIVDYKTDSVSSAEELVPRYRAQMETYVKAVALSMEIPVDKCVLYSLSTGSFAEIPM